MTEKYLHFVWESKRIEKVNLTTVEGQHLQILSFGIRNEQLAGPDFFFGKIRLNGDLLVGNIEIHINSSDWYRHKHHNDSNYNNVILHVVYEYDKEIIQNGAPLPTLELKQFIDVLHHKKYQESKLKINKMICASTCGSIPQIYMESMKAKALEERYFEKYKLMKEFTNQPDTQELMYILLAGAFGTGVNKEGFQELVRKVPLSSLQRIPVRRQQQLLMAESGLMQTESSGHRLTSQWHYKGVRPGGFPDKRLKQFVVVATNFEFEYFIRHCSSDEIIELFLKLLSRALNSNQNLFSVKLSTFMIDHLLINCLAPFLWMTGESQNDECKKELATAVLNRVKPENNKVIRRWKSVGIEVKSAYDSQALLSLNNYFCYRKKCLSCEVGNAVLNQ